MFVNKNFMCPDINKKSITCEHIPELFLDKLNAKKHFGKFGKICRFILRPGRYSCTVDYENEGEAAAALQNGGVYNGHHFDIRYSQKEIGHIQNTEEWVDPEVQAELDVMAMYGKTISSTSSKAHVQQTKVKQKAPRAGADVPAPQQNVRQTREAREELLAIIRKPAYTDEEKYRVLDARDKLIRLTTLRTTDINKVESIKGTCPDMCPEKERYMREFQHQVRCFEFNENNELDHRLAIKEYSRSSADQEMPLTHELRPEPVLKMTMHYLMHRIMQLCDDEGVNIGDWFNFVWDRTRSIRKDITQQELCSPEAVELVEQCARFHIHCAARLVAEDLSVFDQKINTENLTKCLQTLKYMYNDLRIKGIRCQNEAEFRGYIVLLNLNDANFLWELQQLPDDIQKSKEVGMALQFYKYVEGGYYVGFFKLLKNVTYMNACILVRYFNQVRLRALKIILKAYNSPRHVTILPISYLCDILAFEESNEAKDFFSFYGLECVGEKLRLNKNAFEEPDVPYTLAKTPRLVELKRKVSVGEAICGRRLESLTTFLNHKPQNSFNSYGVLQTDIVDIEPEFNYEKKVGTRTNVEENIFKVPMASPPRLPTRGSTKSELSLKPASTQSIFAASSGESIFSQNLISLDPKSSSSFVFKLPSSAPISTAENSQLFSSSTKSNSGLFGPKPRNEPNSFGGAQNISETDGVFNLFGVKPLQVDQEQQRKKEMEKKRQEEEIQRRRQQEAELQRQIDFERQRKLQLEQQKLAQEIEYQKQLKKAEKLIALENLERKSQTLCQQIINEVIIEQVQIIVKKELDEIKVADQLAESIIAEHIKNSIRDAYAEEITVFSRKQMLLIRCVNRWREVTRNKRKRRQLIATLPIWVTPETLAEQLGRIEFPRQSTNLSLIRRYRSGTAWNFEMLLDDKSEHKIDVFSLLRACLIKRHVERPSGMLNLKRFFKLVISLPGEHDELRGFNSFMQNWLSNAVRPLYKQYDPAFMCNSAGSISLCIRVISNIIPTNEAGEKVSTECDNADGILFLLSPGNMKKTRRRLHSIVKLSRINRPIPLVLLYYRVCDDIFDPKDLDVNSLIDDDKISKCHVIDSPYSHIQYDFTKSLKLLSCENTYVCPLQAQSADLLLESCLAHELWLRFSKSTLRNPSFMKICSFPQHLVEVYNDGVDRLIAILGEDFQDYPEIPDELKQFVTKSNFNVPLSLEGFPLDWKHPRRQESLISFLNSIKLPLIEANYPRDQEGLQFWMLDYTSACIPDNELMATKVGHSAITCLIGELNQPRLRELSVAERCNVISWLSVIQQIAEATFYHNWEERRYQLPSEIIYHADKLQEYQTKPWWLINKYVKAVKMTSEETNDLDYEMEVSQEPSVDEVISKAEKAARLADEKLEDLRKQSVVNLDSELTKELDQSLYEFEVNRQCGTFKEVPIRHQNEEEEINAPARKRHKTTNQNRASTESVMQNALSILERAESFLDGYRQNTYQLFGENQF